MLLFSHNWKMKSHIWHHKSANSSISMKTSLSVRLQADNKTSSDQLQARCCLCVRSFRFIVCLWSGAEQNTVEKVCLQSSELISCEWCSVRKLPVLFFQTTPEECVRLRTQLNMSKETGGQWYDCAGDRKSKYRRISSRFKLK